MAQPAKSQEPSMEEILASIRRIIADDDGKSPAPPAQGAAPPQSPAPVSTPVLETNFPEPEEPEILDLTEPMPSAAAPESPGFRTIEPGQDLVFDEAEATPEPPVIAEFPAPEQAPAIPSAAPRDTSDTVSPSTIDMARRQFERETGEDRSLLSSVTTAAVDSAFNSLAQTVLVQNSRTLDDLVREMLRPMLKAWLDDNLPNMVERLVRAEIERVSRGRG
jgi:cell pole-organizing protein PopZ